MSRILVTGATGTVGGAVVRTLLQKGVKPVVAGRKPSAAKSLFGDGVDAVALDFQDPSTYKQAVSGIQSVFLVRPPPISDVKKYINPFIDVAKAEGVKHVVFLSLVGIESMKIAPHYAIEQHLRSAGPAWTFLRAGFFMQNLAGTNSGDIRDHDRIYIPAGDGKTSFVDARDLAEVGVMALLDPDTHAMKAYSLTGKLLVPHSP
jgi:uncharacterized protein YbjT (DUF2867 family)